MNVQHYPPAPAAPATVPSLALVPSAPSIAIPPAPDPEPELIVHEKKVFKVVESDGFEFCVEVPATPHAPFCSWVGARIPLNVWREILKFFEDSYAAHKSETQVRLFYRASDGSWVAWAFPQEQGTGMTARELGDHAQFAPQREALGRGYRAWGTVHHHCSSGAFQSGTDQSNEESQNGLHITVGHIGSAKYDLHGRVYLRKVKYEVNWAEWFEMPERWSDLPVAVRSLALMEVLKEPPPDTVTYPPVWMENLIKVERQDFFHRGVVSGAGITASGTRRWVAGQGWVVDGGGANGHSIPRGYWDHAKGEWVEGPDPAKTPETPAKSTVELLDEKPSAVEANALKRVGAVLETFGVTSDRLFELMRAGYDPDGIHARAEMGVGLAEAVEATVDEQMQNWADHS